MSFLFLMSRAIKNISSKSNSIEHNYDIEGNFSLLLYTGTYLGQWGMFNLQIPVLFAVHD